MPITADGLEYDLLRSKRKTIAVTVRAGGVVEVRAPRWVPQGQIEDFLAQKRGWIDAHRAQMLRMADERSAFRVEPGAALPLLGREVPVLAGERPAFDGAAFRLDPARPGKPQMIGLYRAIARRIIGERVELYAPLVGVRPAGLRITSASTRFGSCSGKNSLNFTWKLVMAELPLVDYVVVHELCHIREHNHSARFWAEVERVLPDYRERERWLKAFAARLQAQNWEE